MCGVLIVGEVLMCYVNHPPRTAPFGTCPLNVNTHTKTSNCGLCTSRLNDPFPLSQIVQTRLLDDFSRRHRIKQVLLHRIAHLVLVRHFDEYFVCLLNPVSVIAVNGVDWTVNSPIVLSPSKPNLVLASRAPHGETQVLVLNGLHFATDRCNGRHHFAKFQLV